MEGDARGFRQHLHTAEEFEDVLVQVLVDIRARLVNRAAVNRRVNGGRATRRSHYDYVLVDSRTGLSDTAGTAPSSFPTCWWPAPP